VWWAIGAIPFALAVLLTNVCVVTAFVRIEKLPVFAPASTVMVLDCSGAAPLLLVDRVTVAPPAAAGPVSVTVPVVEPLPFTVEGLRTIDPTAGALMPKVPIAVAPAYVPVMFDSSVG